MKRKKAAVHTAAGELELKFKANPEMLSDLADKVDPYRQQLVEKLEELSELARKSGTAAAQDAWDKIGPVALQARQSGAVKAQDALEKLTPVLDDAFDKVAPAIESARDTVNDTWLPKLNKLLSDAAESPIVKDAEKAAKQVTKRGKKSATAVRKQLPIPAKKKKNPAKVVGTIALIAAAGGVAWVVVRRFLDNRDSEWEAPAPSAYGGSNSPKRADASPWASDSKPAAAADAVKGAASKAADSVKQAADAAASTAKKVADSAADTAKNVADKAKDVADEAVDKAKDAGDKAPDKPVSPFSAAAASDAANRLVSDEQSNAQDEHESTETRSYGEGSYIGTSPPKGFDIKGNERSMKYHTPGSPAYDRTIAEVWFNSSEAAEQNGFTRAQR